MKRHLFTSMVLAGVLLQAPLFLGGCGDNMFSSMQSKDEKDKGKSALQDGDYAAAADYLEDYIKEHPSDNQARSMLATALLKKSGVDELELAAKITDASKSGGSDWKAIVQVMPEGSAGNIEALNKAVDTLSAIPAESRTKAQNYQLALASASLAVAVVKKSTVDDAGTYQPTAENVEKMSDDEAALVISSIATTAQAGVALGENSAGLTKLTSVSSQITAQTGTTDKEKLTAFILSKK